MNNNLYFDSVKPEKAMAMNMYSTLKRIAKCFRTLEISLSIFFLIYLFTHLPLVLRLSGEYFRCLSSTLTSPLSVFLILNTLVIFLYQNYNNATTPTTHQDHHHQVQTNNHPGPAYTTSTSLSSDSIDRCDPPVVPRSVTELVVYQDKKMIICEEKEKPAADDDVTVNREVKRSQSQGQGTRRRKMHSGKVLSRSKTATEEMELSNEEFRRTIEEFLEKQKKFHHLEQLSSAASVVV